jgi:putative DNA primase/helicase
MHSTEQVGDLVARCHADALAVGRECLDAALSYLARGWAPLALCSPDHLGVGREHARHCGNPGKVPWHAWKAYQEQRPTERELRDRWRQKPNSNVGIALGPVSGLIRVDVEGAAGEARLADLSGGDLPATLEFASGREGGGRGLLYAIPLGVQLRTTFEKLQPNQEVRFQAKGAQTVLPPSRHPSSRRYVWKKGHCPGEIDPALMPPWMIEQLKAGQPKTSDHRTVARPGTKIPEGSRDDTLTSLAGTMRRHGMTPEEILAALLVVNHDRCEPPLSASQVEKIARSVGRYPPAFGSVGSVRATGRRARTLTFSIPWGAAP